tara:strand:+ start:656 stop:1525 length:870 start_codon:yes stop_codon:yes gene_type:complete
MKIDIIKFTQDKLLKLTKKKFSKIYITEYIIPIIDKIIQSKDNKFLISGSQGVGKSTLSILLKIVIEKIYKKKVMLLSIDNYYLSKAKRLKLAKKVHPLLVTRGVPGTHNIKKLYQDINQFNKQKFPISIPHFDKIKDDVTTKRNKISNAQILILEGWFCGSLPIRTKYLYKNINQLESKYDHNKVWRKYYNSMLKNEYKKVFNMFNKKIYMKPPSFKYILKWRSLQENNNANKSNSKNFMNKDMLKKFIQHYEKITKWMMKTMPDKVDMLIKIDKNQKIKRLIENNKL